MPSSDSSTDLCLCGHPHGFHDEHGCADCPDKGSFWEHGFQAAEEPPLTPEEEEELTEGPPCSEVEGCDGQCCKRDEGPPQPERRPPLAIAYSVQGHLYEVALSGDATIVAQDGALIITHALGPVAGIVQARPMEGEQS